MHPVQRNLVDRFAEVFAGNRVGFSAREITEFFGQYSNFVKPHDHYGFNLKRTALFVESLYSLPPKQQYYALNELTWNVQDCRYEYPSEPDRQQLRVLLHTTIANDPIGMTISRIRETAFREDWVSSLSTIQHDPAASITSARTMLETILKTIIHERGLQSAAAGDLGRLIKEAEDAVGFDRRDEQAFHQIVSGLARTIYGIATISNADGNRHGLVHGQSIDDPGIANLVVNACGTIGLAFIELHLFSALDRDLDRDNAA